MITFDCPIYLDSLTMLVNQTPVDIKNEVLGQIQQGDPCGDSIGDDLEELAEELGYNREQTQEAYDKLSLEDLLKYIYIDRENITFDYSEAVAINDRRMAVFNIPCDFDADRFFAERISA